MRNNEFIITHYFIVIIRNNEFIITHRHIIIICNNEFIITYFAYRVSEGAQGHLWQVWFLDWSPCHVGTLPVLQRRQRGQGRCQPPSPLRLWPLRRCGGGGVASLASSSPGTAIPATESNPICTGNSKWRARRERQATRRGRFLDNRIRRAFRTRRPLVFSSCKRSLSAISPRCCLALSMSRSSCRA